MPSSLLGHPLATRTNDGRRPVAGTVHLDIRHGLPQIMGRAHSVSTVASNWSTRCDSRMHSMQARRELQSQGIRGAAFPGGIPFSSLSVETAGQTTALPLHLTRSYSLPPSPQISVWSTPTTPVAVEWPPFSNDKRALSPPDPLRSPLTPVAIEGRLLSLDPTILALSRGSSSGSIASPLTPQQLALKRLGTPMTPVAEEGSLRAMMTSSVQRNGVSDSSTTPQELVLHRFVTPVTPVAKEGSLLSIQLPSPLHSGQGLHLSRSFSGTDSSRTSHVAYPVTPVAEEGHLLSSMMAQSGSPKCRGSDLGPFNALLMSTGYKQTNTT